MHLMLSLPDCETSGFSLWYKLDRAEVRVQRKESPKMGEQQQQNAFDFKSGHPIEDLPDSIVCSTSN